MLRCVTCLLWRSCNPSKSLLFSDSCHICNILLYHVFGMLTNFYFSLKKLSMGRRRFSKQIAAAEEELASKLQMAEAAILPLR